MKPGDTVRVKDVATGRKVLAVVAEVRVDVDTVTFDGEPGRRQMTLTLVVLGKP